MAIDKVKGAERQLLTVEQAAQYLQLSPSSIRFCISYIRQGKSKAFRVAGLRKVLIARFELLALPPGHSFLIPFPLLPFIRDKRRYPV